ncbi:hypothetical protein [Gottfriedia luciferensis]|uniref:hypothetical protein n=1 Tax=Gottfriedia luciferensis TaxID=178774 RepID=UPI000B442340|nr:hypothetical protein [Gottfriedia luciferensis]
MMLIFEYLIELFPIISGITILMIYTLLYLISKKMIVEFPFILSAIVNLLLFPLSFLFSTLPTEDTDGRTFFTNLATFLHFEGVPLVWFVFSFFIYKRFSKKSKLPI